MKLVQRSVCPECGKQTLALIAFDAAGRRESAQCQACHHVWPWQDARSTQDEREDA